MTDKAKPKTEDLKKLTVQGNVYHTTLTRKYENRKKWSKPDKKQVFSVIPGTVRELSVKVGDTVKASEKLMVLEAMKMMNTIYAPVGGKIKTVNITVGDCLPKGTLMIEIE
jgi:biotin carboxyl carrier protein